MKDKLFVLFFLISSFVNAQDNVRRVLTREQHIAEKTAATEKDAEKIRAIYTNHGAIEPILIELCKNKNLPDDIALTIAKKAINEPATYTDQMGSFKSYRIALAENHGVSSETLNLLSQIPFSRENFYPFLHKAIAGNPNTPYKKLKEYMNFYDFAVDLAANKSLSQSDLELLYKSIEKIPSTFGNIKLPPSGRDIIESFIDNPTTPKSILMQIKNELESEKSWWITLLKDARNLDLEIELARLQEKLRKHKNLKAK